MMKKVAVVLAICGVFLLGILTNIAVSQSNRFSDMNDHYAESAAVWASNNGILLGYSDGTFRPDVQLNRGQVALILHRYHSNIVQYLNGRVQNLEGRVAAIHNRTRHIGGTASGTAPTTTTTVLSESERLARDFDDCAVIMGQPLDDVEIVGAGPIGECMEAKGWEPGAEVVRCRNQGGVISRAVALRGIWCDINGNGLLDFEDWKIAGLG